MFALGIFEAGEPSKAAAVYCLLVVVVMTITHVYTYRRGYLYRGRSNNDRVYKKDEPKMFIFWLVFHASLLAALLAIAVFTLLT